jgi:hypothetical protein
MPNPKKRRSSARPRWGWSGWRKMSAPHELKEDVQEIVAAISMPASSGATNVQAEATNAERTRGLTANILDLAGSYRAYVDQDEFGPTRAESMAALRILIGQLNKIDDIWRALPTELADALCHHYKVMACKPESIALYRSDKAIATELHSAILHLLNRKRLPSRDESCLRRLQKEAAVLVRHLAMLDTTTDGDVFVGGYAARKHHLLRADSTGPLAQISIGLRRLADAMFVVLNSLEARKGPQRASSLYWLVGELCEMWQRETGSPVTGDSVGYRGRQPTAAGQFILDLIEAVRPKIDDKSHPSVRAAVFASSRHAAHLRRGQVHQAILRHIRIERKRSASAQLGPQ